MHLFFLASVISLCVALWCVYVTLVFTPVFVCVFAPATFPVGSFLSLSLGESLHANVEEGEGLFLFWWWWWGEGGGNIWLPTSCHLFWVQWGPPPSLSLSLCISRSRAPHTHPPPHPSCTCSWLSPLSLSHLPFTVSYFLDVVFSG